MTVSWVMTLVAPLTPLDWLALLHPVLMFLFVYPVVGATIRLGTLARERRLEINPLPASVGVEHADHGRWATTGVMVAVLIALLVCFIRPSPDHLEGFGGGAGRLGQLLLLAATALAGCLALWWAQWPALRASAALLSWAALLGLGLQPEVGRLSDNPFEAAFWSSHYWSGVLLCGLLLFAAAARPEIQRLLWLRRLHVGAGFLVAVLLAVQAITGCRDLLAMDLLG
jgi:hypothetical protein